MKALAVSLSAVVFVSACAKMNDAMMNTLSSSSPANALVNNTVLSGKFVLFPDRTGTLDLQSESDPMLKCMGTLRYTATQSGVATLRCNDGTEMQLSFTAITETKGYGHGRGGKSTAAFTFGLETAEAAAYLKLPVARPPAPAAAPAAPPQ